MSSLYTPVVRFPKLVDENPTLLTIRKPESAEANDDKSLSAKANDDRLLFGATASECGFESSQASLGCANLGKKLGFEHSEPVASLERSRFLDAAATAGGIGSHRAEDVEIDAPVEKGGSEFRTWSYGEGGGAGGKFRSSHRGNKRTPYERPVTRRHAMAGGSSNIVGAASLPSSKKLTIASWLRDSTTRIIHSSASILFSTVFKRSPPSTEANGNLQGVSIAIKQEMGEGMPDAPAKQNGHSVLASQFPALMDADVTPVEAESSVLDIGKIEEILKQETWSRDQVNRLTQILQEHMSETSETKKTVEAEKVLEQPVVATLDTSPIQVARSYMGEQVMRLSGLAATVHSSAFLSSQAQSSPESTLADDRYASSPFSRRWEGASASVRIPKRSLAIEDDRSLMGPIRRVRQKTSLLATASPYLFSRRTTGLNKPPETRLSSPPSQSSETAKKILETLEKLSPSPQGKLLGAMTEKSLNGSHVLDKFHKGKSISDITSVAMIGANKHTPQISRATDRIVLQNLSLAAPPKSAEAKVNGKPIFGDVNYKDAEVRKPLFETPSFMPHSCNLSMVSKGFRMNAVFEETTTNEEVKSQTRPQLSSVVKDQVAFSKKEVNLTSVSSVVPFSKANGSASSAISLSDPAQKPSSPFFMVNSRTPPHTAGVTNEPTTNLSSIPPSFSYPAVTMETRPSLSDAALSSSAALTIFFSEKKGLKVSNMTTVKSATFDGSTAASEPTYTPVITSVNASECTSTALPVLFSAGTGIGVSGGSLPVLPTSNTHIDSFRSKQVATLATETSVTNNQGEGGTVTTEFVLEEADISGSSGTFLSASGFSVGDGSGKGSAGASSSSLSSTSPFGAQSSTTFAPKPLSGASASLPSVPAFVCGGQSSISSIGEPPTIASEASVSSLSGSPFAFAAQSGTLTTGQEPSLAAWPIFGQSCTSSTGETSCFAASPSSLASNPFQSSAGSSSSFVFGLSHAAVNSPFQSTAGSSSSSVFGSSHAAVFALTSASSSLSSVFTSSAPSFGGSSSMFQFGAPAVSSSLVSGPAASLFSFSPSPAASGTPAFSVFGAVPSSTTAGSASSTTQMFAFGASRSNLPNAFSPSGTEITPFNFAATPSFYTATSGSSALFGSCTSSNVSKVVAFGSASTSNPSPFTFGSGQLSMLQAAIPAPITFENRPAATPSNNDQPFGFSGGQSAATATATAPAPNSFSTAGTAQSSLGFALGATGGDKSVRKFVKAKRIGGTKKGK